MCYFTLQTRMSFKTLKSIVWSSRAAKQNDQKNKFNVFKIHISMRLWIFGPRCITQCAFTAHACIIWKWFTFEDKVTATVAGNMERGKKPMCFIWHRDPAGFGQGQIPGHLMNAPTRDWTLWAAFLHEHQHIPLTSTPGHFNCNNITVHQCPTHKPETCSDHVWKPCPCFLSCYFKTAELY